MSVNVALIRVVVELTDVFDILSRFRNNRIIKRNHAVLRITRTILNIQNKILINNRISGTNNSVAGTNNSVSGANNAVSGFPICVIGFNICVIEFNIRVIEFNICVIEFNICVGGAGLVIAHRNQIQNNAIMKFGIGRISHIFFLNRCVHDDFGHVFIANKFLFFGNTNRLLNSQFELRFADTFAPSGELRRIAKVCVFENKIRR
jgi:hypothetical protein